MLSMRGVVPTFTFATCWNETTPNAQASAFPSTRPTMAAVSPSTMSVDPSDKVCGGRHFKMAWRA